ncbi:hypothetical protein RQP46_005345 [Phenoliferia psychrophenolica]
MSSSGRGPGLLSSGAGTQASFPFLSVVETRKNHAAAAEQATKTKTKTAGGIYQTSLSYFTTYINGVPVVEASTITEAISVVVSTLQSVYTATYSTIIESDGSTLVVEPFTVTESLEWVTTITEQIALASLYVSEVITQFECGFYFDGVYCFEHELSSAIGYFVFGQLYGGLFHNQLVSPKFPTCLERMLIEARMQGYHRGEFVKLHRELRRDRVQLVRELAELSLIGNWIECQLFGKLDRDVNRLERQLWYGVVFQQLPKLDHEVNRIERQLWYRVVQQLAKLDHDLNRLECQHWYRVVQQLSELDHDFNGLEPVAVLRRHGHHLDGHNFLGHHLDDNDLFGGLGHGLECSIFGQLCDVLGQLCDVLGQLCDGIECAILRLSHLGRDNDNGGHNDRCFGLEYLGDDWLGQSIVRQLGDDWIGFYIGSVDLRILRQLGGLQPMNMFLIFNPYQDDVGSLGADSRLGYAVLDEHRLGRLDEFNGCFDLRILRQLGGLQPMNMFLIFNPYQDDVGSVCADSRLGYAVLDEHRLGRLYDYIGYRDCCLHGRVDLHFVSLYPAHIHTRKRFHQHLNIYLVLFRTRHHYFQLFPRHDFHSRSRHHFVGRSRHDFLGGARHHFVGRSGYNFLEGTRHHFLGGTRHDFLYGTSDDVLDNTSASQAADTTSSAAPTTGAAITSSDDTTTSSAEAPAVTPVRKRGLDFTPGKAFPLRGTIPPTPRMQVGWSVPKETVRRVRTAKQIF